MKRVCFHGAESTGKTELAERLGAELGCPVVPEYGRLFAETHGTDFSMDDLLAIAREQHRLIAEAEAHRPPLLIIDTDALMTAAWAEMLFGEVPAELFCYPRADLYLLFAPDVPWFADGTRFFGSADDRERFAAIAEATLVRAGVPYRKIEGDWTAREAQARAALTA